MGVGKDKNKWEKTKVFFTRILKKPIKKSIWDSSKVLVNPEKDPTFPTWEKVLKAKKI